MSNKRTLTKIANKWLGFETLDTRWRDQLDFCEAYVGNVREALEAAYEAGRADQAKKQARP